MIDTNLIKENPKSVYEKLALRNYNFNIELFEASETERKKYQTETEDLQAQRKALSKEFGMLKKEGKDDPALSKKIDSIKSDLDKCSSKLSDIQTTLKELLLDIPNLPDESVPTGKNEAVSYTHLTLPTKA